MDEIYETLKIHPERLTLISNPTINCTHPHTVFSQQMKHIVIRLTPGYINNLPQQIITTTIYPHTIHKTL